MNSRLKVYNLTKGIRIAAEVELACDFWSRLKGLLGRPSLAEGAGLLISPCDSIHTFGMRFPIDAIFVDRSYRVVRVVERLKPFRVVLPVRGALSVIELPADTARRTNTERGDQLEVST
jgi:hypothetical protein